MWQGCINKRLIIIINEPYFDQAMLEQLKVILESTGTFVHKHKKNSSDEYQRPTSVIITSNTYIWDMWPGSNQANLVRVMNLCDKLKSCPLLKTIKKDLHPLWLNLVADKYLTNKEKEAFSFSLPNNEEEQKTVTTSARTPSILHLVPSPWGAICSIWTSRTGPVYLRHRIASVLRTLCKIC